MSSHSLRTPLPDQTSDIGQRSRLLGQLSQQMKRLGDRHRATFVVVNQVLGAEMCFQSAVVLAWLGSERGLC